MNDAAPDVGEHEGNIPSFVGYSRDGDSSFARNAQNVGVGSGISVPSFTYWDGK